MTTTGQLRTFSDLYTDLINRVRSATGVSGTETQAKRYINIALQDIHLGFHEKCVWAERRAVLRTRARYTTGTCTIAKGATALTGTSTLWNTADAFGVTNMRAGGKIVIDGGSDVYEITSVTTDTAAVLANAFISTSVTAVTYVYFEDEYALASDFLRPVDAQSFDDARDIALIGRMEFRRRFPRPNITGTPIVATINDVAPSGNTTPRRRLQLWRPPSIAQVIPYTYITGNLALTSAGVAAEELSGDTDEPIVPLRARHLIALHALASWYRDKKDDTRAEQVKAEYTDGVLRLMSDHEIGQSRPQFQPRLSTYARRARSPWNRGAGRRVGVGDRFDRMED